MEKDLTPRQMKFVDEYLTLGNGTRAAIKAGYSEKTAEVQASRLLKNVKVQEELKQRRDQLEQELRNQFVTDALTARKVMIDILNDNESADKDKLTAARDLLDRAGFKPTDKKEISGKDGDAIEIVFTNPE